VTWAGALTAFHADLRTAAAAVSPTIDSALVQYGEPDTLNGDAIAFWAEGWRDSHTGGDTFTKKSIERGVRVVIFLRGAARAGAVNEALETRLVTVEVAVIQELLNDLFLNGNAIGLYVESGTYGWQDFAGQWTRTASFVAWIDLPEVFTLQE
jgi:hypothetical protein